MEIFNVLQWVFLGVFILVVVLCVVFTIVGAVKKHNKQKLKKANPVKIQDNVRYSKTDEIETENGEVKISYVKEDIILQPRKMVVVSKKGPIKPGKYTVLSAYENEQKFNVRIGNFVKECTHGQEIVLAEGDEICPTSVTIILR